MNAICNVCLLHKQDKTAPNHQEPMYRILHSQSGKNIAEPKEKFNYSFEWRIEQVNPLQSPLHQAPAPSPGSATNAAARSPASHTSCHFPKPVPVWGWSFCSDGRFSKSGSGCCDKPVYHYWGQLSTTAPLTGTGMAPHKHPTAFLSGYREDRPPSPSQIITFNMWWVGTDQIV